MIKQKKGEIKIFLILLVSLMFVVVGSGLVSADCPEGMVSYWTFDDADLSGSDPLDTVGDNDGTNVGGVTTGQTGENSVVGQAFSFDGNNDYINVSDSESLDIERTNELTIGFWVKLNSANTQQTFLRKSPEGGDWEGYGIQLNGSTSLNPRFLLRNSQSNQLIVDANVGLTVGQWTYVAITYDGSSSASGVNIYINGGSVSTTTPYDTLSASILNNEALTIGSIGSGSWFFNGLIDEVAIFNRSLSAEEISALYDLGVAEKGYCEGEAVPGNLTTYWITPTTDTNVQQDEFFKVQIGVNCTGGDCGDVNVTLDPKEVQKAIEDYKAQQNIITGEVVEEVENEMNFFERIIDFIKGVFGG